MCAPETGFAAKSLIFIVMVTGPTRAGSGDTSESIATGAEETCWLDPAKNKHATTKVKRHPRRKFSRPGWRWIMTQRLLRPLAESAAHPDATRKCKPPWVHLPMETCDSTCQSPWE